MGKCRRDKNTIPMDLDSHWKISTLSLSMCRKCTHIRSNSMCALVHILSPISTQAGFQTANGTMSISKSTIQPEFSGYGIHLFACSKRCQIAAYFLQNKSTTCHVSLFFRKLLFHFQFANRFVVVKYRVCWL